jgi:hypothetical protein
MEIYVLGFKMKKIIWNKISKGYTFIKILGITVLAFLMLINISGAVSFVYITNAGSNTVSIINTSTKNYSLNKCRAYSLSF